jgi:hypothetical protein
MASSAFTTRLVERLGFSVEPLRRHVVSPAVGGVSHVALVLIAPASLSDAQRRHLFRYTLPYTNRAFDEAPGTDENDEHFKHLVGGDALVVGFAETDGSGDSDGGDVTAVGHSLISVYDDAWYVAAFLTDAAFQQRGVASAMTESLLRKLPVPRHMMARTQNVAVLRMMQKQFSAAVARVGGDGAAAVTLLPLGMDHVGADEREAATAVARRVVGTNAMLRDSADRYNSERMVFEGAYDATRVKALSGAAATDAVGRAVEEWLDKGRGDAMFAVFVTSPKK